MEKSHNISQKLREFVLLKFSSRNSSTRWLKAGGKNTKAILFSVCRQDVLCRLHRGHASQFITQKSRKYEENSKFVFISSRYRLKAKAQGRPNNKNIMTMENQRRLRALNISEQIFIGWNHSNCLKNKLSVPDFWSFRFPYLFVLRGAN